MMAEEMTMITIMIEDEAEVVVVRVDGSFPSWRRRSARAAIVAAPVTAVAGGGAFT